jgi:hypothetical protein
LTVSWLQAVALNNTPARAAVIGWMRMAYSLAVVETNQTE